MRKTGQGKFAKKLFTKKQDLLLTFSCLYDLKGQSHQNFVLLENPMKVLVSIGNCLTLLKCIVLVTKVV